MPKYKTLTKQEKAQKALELAKKQEADKGKKPTFLKNGITGENLTGQKRWN